MYICLDCGYLFNEAKPYVEKHGLDTPPYEHLKGCPNCLSGSYVETPKCDICGTYATNRYIVTKEGQVVCDQCYKQYQIGEE